MVLVSSTKISRKIHGLIGTCTWTVWDQNELDKRKGKNMSETLAELAKVL